VRFVDTSVLLYAISRDPAEQDKAKRASGILAERDLALSVQVLQEFYVQATRPSRPDAIGHRQAVCSSSRSAVSRSRTSRAGSCWRPGGPPALPALYWDAAIIEASARWAVRLSCPRTSATARTTAASWLPTRSVNAYKQTSSTGAHPWRSLGGRDRTGLRAPGHVLGGGTVQFLRLRHCAAARTSSSRPVTASAAWSESLTLETHGPSPLRRQLFRVPRVGGDDPVIPAGESFLQRPHDDVRVEVLGFERVERRQRRWPAGRLGGPPTRSSAEAATSSDGAEK